MSVQATERYLGCKQRIQSAVNDRGSASSPSFELGLRMMEGLPTIREQLAHLSILSRPPSPDFVTRDNLSPRGI
jgi:hypothetical protein